MFCSLAYSTFWDFSIRLGTAIGGTIIEKLDFPGCMLSVVFFLPWPWD